MKRTRWRQVAVGRAVAGAQAIGLVVSAGRIGAQEEAAPAPEAVSGADLVLSEQQASSDGPVRVSAEVKRSGGGGLVPGGVTVRGAPGLAEGAIGNVSRHHPGDAVTETVIDPNGKPVASFEARVTTERGHVQLPPAGGRTGAWLRDGTVQFSEGPGERHQGQRGLTLGHRAGAGQALGVYRHIGSAAACFDARGVLAVPGEAVNAKWKRICRRWSVVIARA